MPDRHQSYVHFILTETDIVEMCLSGPWDYTRREGTIINPKSSLVPDRPRMCDIDLNPKTKSTITIKVIEHESAHNTTIYSCQQSRYLYISVQNDGGQHMRGCDKLSPGREVYFSDNVMVKYEFKAGRIESFILQYESEYVITLWICYFLF